ncbi:MAG: right-handed parallel beta-helix repeat-containing protein, partial [Chitinophagaceae bacterium]
ATAKLYLYSTTDPGNMEISATILEHLLVAHNFGYFSFRNLAFEGANNTLARLQNSTSVSFTDCRFRFAANEALTSISTDYVTVANSLIADISNIGITLDRGSRNAIVKNNEIRNIAAIAGMGSSGDESYHAIISRGNKTVIERNNIDSVGYIAIRFEGDSVLIKNNFINHFMIAKADGAAIYTWKSESNKTANRGRRIVDNIILNGRGEGEGTSHKNEVIAAGIYLDDNADNIDVSGNTVAHCSYAGLYLHNTQNIVVRDNTFYNNGQQVLFSHDWNAPANPLRDIVFTDNVLFSNGTGQLVLKIQTIRDDIGMVGVIDSNFYSSPAGTKEYIQATLRRDSMDVYESTNMKGWQQKFKHDLLTRDTVSVQGEVRFEYNASMTPINISLSEPCVDERGTERRGIMELLPFSSVVLTLPATGDVPKAGDLHQPSSL